MSLLPPNFVDLQIPRHGPEPDLIVPWRTPYPMHGAYLLLCKEAGLDPYGGGSRTMQGRKIPGYINSGYRDIVIDGNDQSPHFYGFAWDIFVGKLSQQVRVAKIANKYFTRVGLYPDSDFIHVDLAPDNWIDKYNKRRSWLRHKGKYHSFPNLYGSLTWLQKNVDPSITLV